MHTVAEKSLARAGHEWSTSFRSPIVRSISRPYVIVRYAFIQENDEDEEVFDKRTGR